MRRTLTILPLLLLVGCSGAMQDFGKRLVVGRVADEFNLDREQRRATRASVDRLVEAAPELLGPRLEVIFEDAEAAITAGFPEGDLITIEDRMEAVADDAMAAIFDELAPLLATLRPEQVDHFAARAEERLAEAWEKRSGTPAERLAKRQETFIEEVEKWTGSLDDEQEQALHAVLEGLPDEGAIQLDLRETKTRELLQLLRDQPGEDRIRARLWEIWRSRDDWGTEARSRDARSAEGRELLRTIDGLIRPKQRAHMKKHLRSLHDRAKAFLGTN